MDVCVGGFDSQLRASFTYFGLLLHKHINCQYNESVHRKEQDTSGINTIPQKIATLLTFETLKWEYSSIYFRDRRAHCYP